MTKTKLRKALEALDLASPDHAADFFGVYERTVRRWTHGEKPVPQAVAMLLTVMLAENITTARVAEIMRTSQWRL